MRSAAGSAQQVAASRTPPISYAETATALNETPERASPVRLVVGTNVALKVYLEEDLADEAQRVLEAGRDGDAELLAPTLILLEFRHALTRRVRREGITVAEAKKMWGSFGDWPLVNYEIAAGAAGGRDLDRNRMYRLRCHLRDPRESRRGNSLNRGLSYERARSLQQ